MNIGDLVRIREHDFYEDSGLIGLVQWVDTKYPPQCSVLIKDKILIYDTRGVEAINEQ